MATKMGRNFAMPTVKDVAGSKGKIHHKATKDTKTHEAR
jgi:hypothetical protein